jgi:flagellar M-ring protein FliF
LQAELLSLRRLLQGGIGFDVARGDSLEVVSIPFSREDDYVPVEVPIYEQPLFWRLFRYVGGFLIIVILIFALVRPILKKLIDPENTTEVDDFESDDALDLGDETISMLSQEFDEGQVGFAADGSLMLPDLHKDEDVLKAVRALVANEPELSAQVVKGWLMMDE